MGLYGRRWIISAVLTVCAFGLSAQTYYRVHKDEFSIQVKSLKDYKDYFIFAIGSPENGVVWSESLNTSGNIIGVTVTASDDFESINCDNNEKISFNLVPNDNNSGSGEFGVNIYDFSGMSSLGITGGTSPKFAYDPTATNSSTDFNLIFDPNNEGFVQIKSDLKNSNLSVEPASKPDNSFEFKPLSNNYSGLCLYRLDFFEWQIKDDKVKEEGQITLISTPHDLMAGIANPTYIHYILNDGEDVTIEELINSTNQIQLPKIRKNTEISLSIPTNEIQSRVNDNNTNTTLWALPVNHDEDFNELIPMGKVITKKYADDGISTGILSVGEDTASMAPVYYTLDGRKAALPLAPGVYVRRIGDKANKMIIR